MKLLYDTDDYAVVHLVSNANEDGTVRGWPDHCFEIVDKTSNKEILLRGAWAAAFKRQIEQWQRDTPAKADVDMVLQGFCALAQLPLVVH